MMTADDVLKIVNLLEEAGIEVWLDGGWGVDALLGSQSRPHDDLDVVISIDDVVQVRMVLQSRGFQIVEDELPTRFVMRDLRARRIDFHPVRFDEQGSGVQTLQDGTPALYPADGFTNEGSIRGNQVGCLTPEVQMRHHTGYPPDAKDAHDVRRLHERFGIELPEIYRDWNS